MRSFCLSLIAGLSGLLPLLQAEEWQPTTFEVKVAGQGPPVVLIPGLSCSGEIWNATVERLKQRYECHVISIKGFGGVEAMEQLPDPLLAAVRDEIIAYIRSRKLDHPAIVGHSLGGSLALDIAASAPDLPGRIVVVDSCPFMAGMINPQAKPGSVGPIAEGLQQKMSGMTREEFESVQALVIRTMANDPGNVEYLTKLANRSDPHTVSRALTELFMTDLRPVLGRIRCPALIILAMADRAVFQPAGEIEKNFQAQYAGLSGARFLVFEKARHFIMYDEPEKFLEALDAALAEGGNAPRENRTP